MTNLKKQIQIVLDDSNFSNIQLLNVNDIERSFNIFITNQDSSYEMKTFINGNINDIDNKTLRNIIAKSLLNVIKEEYRYTYENDLFEINNIHEAPQRTKESLQTLYLLITFYEAITKTITNN